MPQITGPGCEVRAKGVGFSVQRAKGSTDEPTVGDSVISALKVLMCLPVFDRVTKGQVGTIPLRGRLGSS